MSATERLTTGPQHRTASPVPRIASTTERRETRSGPIQSRRPHARSAHNVAPNVSARAEADRKTVRDSCVAVIDPDKTYRKAMASCLRLKGFDVLELEKADAYCIEALIEAGAEAALISSEAFQDDGRFLLETLRAHRPGLQLAVVSAQPDQSVEETLLAAGAADFFDRRRSSAIVTKRLSLLVEGARGVADAAEEGEETLDRGPLRLRLQSHRALWRSEEIPLTVTEFRIVRLLASAGEAGANYREIYDMVHGAGFNAGDGPDGYRTNVRSLIRRIRAKFHAESADFDAIENLPGRGYRWRTGETSSQRSAVDSAGKPSSHDDRSEAGALG